jgi:hypothetical protein
VKALYAIIAGASILGGAFVACSNGNGQADGGSDAGDAGIDVVIDPQNCVPPGTAPNDQGMGGYCSPGGEQCVTAGPGGAPRICTADVTGTPAHAWFCTYPCTSSSMCGTGASCITTAMGSGCVPTVCDYLDDAGLIDSPTDAPTDAPGDGSNG